MWLPLTRPLLETWTTTQACALTGNRTRNPLVHRSVLNLLSHTTQGSSCFFQDPLFVFGFCQFDYNASRYTSSQVVPIPLHFLNLEISATHQIWGFFWPLCLQVVFLLLSMSSFWDFHCTYINTLYHVPQFLGLCSFFLIGEREREKGRRERNTDLSHILVHSLVDSCMFPDWVSNFQPWRSRTL